MRFSNEVRDVTIWCYWACWILTPSFLTTPTCGSTTSLYTMESFREAREHLNPDGVLFLKFAVDRPWMGRRLWEMLQQTFGRPPIVFYAGSSYTPAAVCFAISGAGTGRKNIWHAMSNLADFVSRNRFATDSSDVPLATDDWPYLYQRE